MSLNITMHGKPVKVAGKPLKVGDKAPDFTVIDPNMAPISLSSFKGKVVVINSVPSIDTPVCDMQVRRFNQEASTLGDIKILSVSVDLPFALDKYCATAGINKVITTSDHRELDFGKKYGVVLEDFRLLTRAIIVIDKEGIVQYVEYVPEISDSPNFDAALKAIKKCL